MVRFLSPVGEIAQGLWQFATLHPDAGSPEWTSALASGEDGWNSLVAWWVVATPGGLVLIDPLVDDWPALDRLLSDRGECVGIVRTCHWHQRSVSEAASRYRVPVWAKVHAEGSPTDVVDHPVGDQDEILEAIQVIDTERADEIAIWLREQRALLFGDAMIRRDSGALRICPDSWQQPIGGPARLRARLGELTDRQPEHVLVSHGPLVMGDGLRSLRAATKIRA